MTTGNINNVFIRLKKKFSLANLFPLYEIEKFTDSKKLFWKSLKFFRANVNKEKTEGVLLVQLVRDYYYVIKLAAASKALAEKENLEVSLHDVKIYWTRKRRIIESVFDVLFKGSLNKLHFAFADKIVFKNYELYKDQKFIKNELVLIIDGLKGNDPANLLELKFDDIPVGDLIYDTYLRFFHKPTIEVINEDVITTIEIALNIFYNFKTFLKHSKVKILLNSYVSYIHHGITARICIQENIRVYTIGSPSYIIQEMTDTFPYHQINHTLFSRTRELSSQQLQLAQNSLESRFTGIIDTATSYMKRSAFTGNAVSPEVRNLFLSKKRNIVIYPHEFYDSPHINRMLQFPDLYLFLRQTLVELTDMKDTNVFIKIHPNGMPGNKEKTNELVNSFHCPHFYILDDSVSNLNIVELKPDLIGTARGTVGIEMAYFEIPTVALYDNLYVDFKFVHTCMDKGEYFSILRGEVDPSVDFNKHEIYSFYYQAYIDKLTAASSSSMTLLKSFKGDTYSDAYLEHLFLSGYENARAELVDYYRSGLQQNN